VWTITFDSREALARKRHDHHDDHRHGHRDGHDHRDDYTTVIMTMIIMMITGHDSTPLHYRACRRLEAVILNKAMSPVVVAPALPFRASAVPFGSVAAQWAVIVNLLAANLLGPGCGRASDPTAGGDSVSGHRRDAGGDRGRPPRRP
jgi:hypothetical protein